MGRIRYQVILLNDRCFKHSSFWPSEQDEHFGAYVRPTRSQLQRLKHTPSFRASSSD